MASDPALPAERADKKEQKRDANEQPAGGGPGLAGLVEQIGGLQALVRAAKGRPLAPEEASAVAALIETLGALVGEES